MDCLALRGEESGDIIGDASGVESGVDSRDVSGEVSSDPEVCKKGSESSLGISTDDDSADLLFTDAAPCASESLYNLCIKRRCASSLLGAVPRYTFCDTEGLSGVVLSFMGPLGTSLLGPASSFFWKKFITMFDR